MISATTTIRTETFIEGARFQTKFNRTIQGIGAQVANELKPIVAREFIPPGAAKHPIQWTSAKQRRYVMMILRGANNIPYQRTGEMDKKWIIAWSALEASSGQFKLSNPLNRTRFVRGGFKAGNTFQQRFHINTGWRPAIEAKNAVFDEGKRLYRDHFHESVGSFGYINKD